MSELNIHMVDPSCKKVQSDIVASDIYEVVLE